MGRIDIADTSATTVFWRGCVTALKRSVRRGGLVLGVLAVMVLPDAWAAPEPLGPVTSASALTNGAQLALQGGGSMTLKFLAQGMVHVNVIPPGRSTLPTGAVVFDTPAAGSAEFFQDSDKVFVRQGELAAIIMKNPLQVVIMRSDGSVISADLPGGALVDRDGGTVVMVKQVRPDERFFGMGLAGGPLDRRGRTLTMRNTDNAAYDEFTNPLYSSTPFFYGHTGGSSYGLYVDNPTISVFDFAKSSPNVLSVASTGGTLNYYVLAGPTPAAVAESFKSLTGATPVPPKWSLGYLQAHFGYASAAEVLGLAREFRSRGIPCDAFFLDLDYNDRLFTLTWNPSTWPNPVAFNTEMESMGFKRVNIIEPLMTVYDPLWAYTAANRWFVTGPTGDPLVTNIWLGDVSFVDFTKPAAREFFKGAVKSFLSTGVSGLWADLNEPAANYLPYAIFDFEGQPRYEYASRNIYALWEAATLNDALKEAQPGLRPFIVSRSGFAGIQRYAANWSGDTHSTWDSLRVQVQVANSMGLSGQNFFGADIGGFLGAPDAELFLRWLQFGSATPFMRNHSINTVPLREPWRFGEPYTSAAKAIIEWRYRLMPYLYGLFVAAENTGAPVLAPTYFHHPSDTQTHAASSEFMLGASMLVAPVTTPGASTRTLYLPAGSAWFNYYSDQLHAGGQTITVPAPIHQLPLMVRAGSIIPMGPVRQHAGDTAVADFLMLDVFPGASATFTLRDDDGATTAYRQGAFRDTTLNWTEAGSVAELSAQVSGGSLAEPARPWWLQVRAWSGAPSRVLADGVVLARANSVSALNDAGGWSYDQNLKRLVVRTPANRMAARVRIER